MPEFLEKRYNSEARSFLSIISLVSYILTKVAVTVYAGGVVFKDVFNIEYVTFFGYNIDFFWISAIGLVVLTGLYTTFGGMKAAVSGDSLLKAKQFITEHDMHQHAGPAGPPVKPLMPFVLAGTLVATGVNVG